MIKSISTFKKKGQAWGIDLAIASIIFLIGILSLYFYSLNLSREVEENFDILIYEGEVISSLLLSEGNPADWTNETVIRAGLTTNNKINETKLYLFYNISQEDYLRFKQISGTKYDFYMFFSNTSIYDHVEGVGKSGVNSTNIMDIEKPENIIQINRFTIYKDKPVSMNIYVWRGK